MALGMSAGRDDAVRTRCVDIGPALVLAQASVSSRELTLETGTTSVSFRGPKFGQPSVWDAPGAA
jgi:hypothetical protein